MDRSRHRRLTRAAFTAIVSLALVQTLALSDVEGLTLSEVDAQQAAPIILVSSTEQIPLNTYAEMMRIGTLRIVSGSRKDIPTVSDVDYFRCGLTGWSPKGVLVASEELFTSEYAERRLIPVFIRPVAVSTVVARAADLEKPDRIAELRRAVRVPEGGDHSYFFLILSSGDMTRYYPFRIAPPK